MSKTAGSMTMALAMAIRCFMPPESSWTSFSALPDKWTICRARRTRSARSEEGIPAIFIPNSTFCAGGEPGKEPVVLKDHGAVGAGGGDGAVVETRYRCRGASYRRRC